MFEVQNINSASIINFKNSVGNSDLFSQFDLSLDANPNDNYNILSSILQQAKNRHIPKKIQRLNRRKHCMEPWMNRELLTLINKKNDKYRDWKSTNNDVEYEETVFICLRCIWSLNFSMHCDINSYR